MGESTTNRRHQMNERHDPQPRDDDWSNALPFTERDTHMKMSQMMQSAYLKQDDVPDPVTVTVESLKKANLAREDEVPDYQWTVKYREFEKSMVLKPTNLKRMFKYLGDDTDDWFGKQIVLYVDHDVEFKGEIVGGLRVRALGRAEKPKLRTDDGFLEKANRAFDEAAEDPPF